MFPSHVQPKRTPERKSFHRRSRLVTLLGIAGLLAVRAHASQAQPPRIEEVRAVAAGVEVTAYRGDPAPASGGNSTGGLDVVVSSPFCGEVGRVFASTSTETVTVTVPQALGNVALCGTGYAVFLEDSGVQVGEALPFRIALDCDVSNVCAFEIERGVESHGALVLSDSLYQAMAQGTGSGDLVAAVSAAQPQLRDEVLTHALHLDRLLTSQGTTLGGQPVCTWAGVVGAQSNPVDPTWPQAPHDPGICADVLTPSREKEGITTLETINLCHVTGLWPPISLTLPGGQGLALPSMDLAASPAAGAEPSWFFLSFQGVAMASGSGSHEASARVEVDFFLNGEFRMDGSASAYRGPDHPVGFDDQELDLAVTGLATQGSIRTYSVGEVLLVPLYHGDLGYGVGAAVDGEMTLEAAHQTLDAWFRVQDRDLNDSLFVGDDPVACEGEADSES